MIADKKFLRGPRLGHLLGVGNAGIHIGGMGNQRAWIGRGGGNFDLRLLFGDRRGGGLWTKSPAGPPKKDQGGGEGGEDKFDGGVWRRGGNAPGKDRELGGFCR